MRPDSRSVRFLSPQSQAWSRQGRYPLRRPLSLHLGQYREDLDRLVRAMEAISHQAMTLKSIIPINVKPPYAIASSRMNPREAFFSSHQSVPLEEALGKTAADIVTVYPPGIPLLIPGEEITQTVLDHLILMRETGATLDGLDSDNRLINIV